MTQNGKKASFWMKLYNGRRSVFVMKKLPKSILLYNNYDEIVNRVFFVDNL